MVMVDGMSQRLTREDQSLSVTYFQDFTYDISDLLNTSKVISPNRKHMPTAALLLATDEMAALARDSRGEILEEAHKRLNDPILCVVAALLGFSALLAGGFSRFGSGSYIMLAVLLIIVIMMVQSAVKDPVRDNAALWPLTYLPSVVGFGMVLVLLMVAAGYFRRKPKAEATV
jgi:lipopolysaccharide export system permease protein